MTSAIKCKGNDIAFKFEEKLDPLRNNMFSATTESGIYIPPSPTDTAHKPRWAKVVSIGSDCLDVKVDMRILIEPGAWTNNFEIDGVKHWKTDESKVLAVEDERA